MKIPNHNDQSQERQATNAGPQNTIQQKSQGTQKSSWQSMANNSAPVKQAMSFQQMANKSPQAKEAAQLKAMANPTKTLADAPAKDAPTKNNTGLPDNLKTGIENLSGYSMDDVKVHRNSSKPAQLQAHAYAQGTDIHLGPGQEKHLPHEAWHVVQQKEGRVKPTVQMKGGVDVNDDAGLEKEADVMGGKILRDALAIPRQTTETSPVTGAVVQKTGDIPKTKGGRQGKNKKLIDENNFSEDSYDDLSEEDDYDEFSEEESRTFIHTWIREQCYTEWNEKMDIQEKLEYGTYDILYTWSTPAERRVIKAHLHINNNHPIRTGGGIWISGERNSNHNWGDELDLNFVAHLVDAHTRVYGNQ